jgi:hypothetical protein
MTCKKQKKAETKRQGSESKRVQSAKLKAWKQANHEKIWLNEASQFPRLSQEMLNNMNPKAGRVREENYKQFRSLGEELY